MRDLIAIPVRLFAFLGKELVETVRRPGALVSLVLGPFLIMAIFAFGYDGYRNPLKTVIVAAPETGLPQKPTDYSEIAGNALMVTEVTADRSHAQEQLANQQVEVVIVAPEDAEEQFRAGEQSVIEVEVNIVDPVQAAYAAFVVQLLASEVNREIIERVAEEGQSYAVAAGDQELAQIPPEIVASPTKTELVNIAPLTPGVVAFFGPAVLALILQHLAVTLAAMSLVRERTSGVLELFRIAPISSAEIIAARSWRLACSARRSRRSVWRCSSSRSASPCWGPTRCSPRSSASCCWPRSALASSWPWSPIRSARPSSCRC